MKTILPAAALILGILHAHAPCLRAEVRAFTSTTGTVIKGELDTINGDMVTIKREGGPAITTKAANFSAADLAYLRGHGLRDAGIATEPAGAAKDKPFVNSIGMQFVPVPGTQILFCTHITRRADYAAYAAATPNADPTWKGYPLEKDSQGKPLAQGDDYPVVGVNWGDAKRFCDWLSQKEGRVYRMPSDREWSYAVGIGKQEEAQKSATPEMLKNQIKNVYAWGTTWPPPAGVGNFYDETAVDMFPTRTENGKTVKNSAPDYKDGYALTSPAFAFRPNQLGIFDLAGNIHQWCDGWYDQMATKRLNRGCPYNHWGKESLAAAWRVGFDPETRLIFNIGFSSFRCVVELPVK